MALQTRSWEQALLSLAQEAVQATPSTFHIYSHHTSHTLLHKAYAHCEEITALHSRSFHLASSLLPPDKCRAVRALYAFCRVSDDIVDCDDGGATTRRNSSADLPDESDVHAALAAWRGRILNNHPARDDLVAVAWTHARTLFQVPHRYAEQLIEGVERDLYQTRYETFQELAAYCYGVASTVGLMSMHIIGYAGDHAIPYAIKLGVALQMTNILRDVAEDWQAGRLYLPREELDAYGLRDEHLDAGEVTEGWRRFMRFQIERNRNLYAEAMPGIKLLDPNGRFAIAAAAELYRAILEDIEAHDYDIFSRRSYISKWGKISRLPGIWWRSR
jgi:phytoene synthase